MADDYSLSDFVTPGQVKAQREMAEALLRQSLQPPVGRVGEAVSPFAIGTQMSEALAGKYLMNKAGQQERTSEIGGQLARPDTPGVSGAYSTPSRRADDGSIDAEGKALSMLESGGDYNALGPIIKHGAMAGDRAYGKYQVMGTNIPKWTQEFLGHQMTPGEFLRDPAAQEAVRKGKFAQYVQAYGPEGAARAWLGGPGGVNHPERADQLGTTIGQYGQNFTRNLAQLGEASPSSQGGQALAFSGEPAEVAPESPGSPGAVSSALAGEKVAAGRSVPPGSVALPPATGGGIAPGTIPTRPAVSRAQFDRASLGADEQTRALLNQQYYGQNQPVVVKDSLGRDVVVGRDGSQMLINPPITMKQKIGDIEQEPRYTQEIGPDGRPYLRQERTVGPGGAAPRPAAPTAPEEPVPSLKFAPEEKGAAGEALPAEITKGPEAAKAERGGMLGTEPPKREGESLPFAETHLPNAPTGTESGVETPDLANMSIAQQAEWYRQFKLNQESAQKFNDADTQEVIKSNKTIQDVTKNATQARDYVGLAKKMLSDPRLQSMVGPGANLKYDWKSFLSFLGNQDAEAQRGLVDAFKKVTSSGIIGTLKSDYGGLGQIRNKEIELSEKATISPTNTVAANMAVLDIADKTIQRHQMVGKLVNLYINGQRWDEDGNPIKGKSTERPTFAELSGVVNKYLENHPIYDDKVKDASGKTQLDHTLDLFKSSEKTEKKKGSSALPPGSKADVEPAAATPTPARRPLATHELPPGGSFH